MLKVLLSKKRLIFSLAFLIAATMFGALGAEQAFAKGKALVIELEGAINPASAMVLARGMEKARETGASLVIIRLDTPGGLGSSMRTMVKSIMNSQIPVVVWVGPSGAGAASAGVLITIAAHVAAMAPSTNIGAAHPVLAGGKEIGKTMSEKVVNDMASYARGIAKQRGRNGEWVEKAIRESVSITAEEAVRKHVVDLTAPSLQELLKALDGREVEVAGQKIKLKTVGIKLVYYHLGFRDRVLQTISDPNIAYILMMIGMAGLYFELAHPGAILPGVIGAISLVLAFYSFQTLPVNYAGLLLIALAIIFFIAEIKVTSYGMLSIGGLVSLILGSIMLFENMRVSLKLMAPTVALVGGFFVVVATLAFRAYRAKPRSGAEGLIGEVGTVKQRIDPEGLVFVHGEHWRAVATEPIEEGEKVQIEGMDGLVLKVRKV
ncbi:MAG: nodulation protein NfeD [Deltaproteobacteria bacterium]|nr:nodulation protein NfeD [Deltaproteobacteria bacterium]MBW2083501.1 nodulation protein NfeD [Deltaproteobacteria bacterium]